MTEENITLKPGPTTISEQQAGTYVPLKTHKDLQKRFANLQKRYGVTNPQFITNPKQR